MKDSGTGMQQHIWGPFHIQTDEPSSKASQEDLKTFKEHKISINVCDFLLTKDIT
jgi:hypothetical protein